MQSNYIAWKGYFDLIAAVDEFILYDDMQYTRRDWRNRNHIKTPQGVQWLSVPVRVKGKYHQTIRETEIDGCEWADNHWKNLVRSYRAAACFDELAALLEPYYYRSYAMLSVLNRDLIECVCGYLGITTKISNSWDYILVEGKSKRLASLCMQAGGTEYVSGPSARHYLDEPLFAEHGLKVTWFDYSGYPEYPQLWGGVRPRGDDPRSAVQLRQGRPALHETHSAMKLSVLATLYRSAPCLEKVDSRAGAAARQRVGEIYEIVLVNDGSPEHSLDLAVRLAEAVPHLAVVDLSRNFGHHKAMMTSLKHAIGERVFPDQQQTRRGTRVAARFFVAVMATEKADVDYGRKESRKGGWFERWSGEVYYAVFN